MATSAEIAKALKLADGDFLLAGKILGMRVDALRNRVSKDGKLRAVWGIHTGATPPTELSVINRETPPRAVVEGSALADAIQKQNSKLLRDGLEESGISPATINKLAIFDKFGQNSGHFLIASLDLTHKMMILGNASLFEQLDIIKIDYLDNKTLTPEVRMEWQKVYNEIADILGKNYERVLAGTQAMAKMMKKDDDKPEKTKPGFKPQIAEKRHARKD